MLGSGEEHEVDRAYTEIVADLPAHLRAAAARLPYRLGLVHRPDGKWSDFTQLEVVTSMPRLIGRDLGLSDAQVEPFLRAHRAAGFARVLVDRVADGQAQSDPDLDALAAALHAAWVAALGAAVGDAGHAALIVEAGCRSFARSARAERRALSTGAWTAEAYARAVGDKTAWLAVATVALLRAHRDEQIARVFVRGHERLYLSLQLLDDAVDAADDRAVRGRSMPEVLRATPRAFVRAAACMTDEAAFVFDAAGLPGLAAQSRARGSELTRVWVDGHPVLDAFATLALSEEALLRGLDGHARHRRASGLDRDDLRHGRRPMDRPRRESRCATTE